MTGHRISCQKSKFPLSLLFNQIFSSQYAVLLFAEQFSPTFFLMKFFFFLIIGTPAFVLFQLITSLYKKDLNDAWTFTSVQGNEK